LPTSYDSHPYFLPRDRLRGEREDEIIARFVGREASSNPGSGTGMRLMLL
jgi:hypothetical protein